jgi:hypothetical protein
MTDNRVRWDRFGQKSETQGRLPGEFPLVTEVYQCYEAFVEQV